MDSIFQTTENLDIDSSLFAKMLNDSTSNINIKEPGDYSDRVYANIRLDDSVNQTDATAVQVLHSTKATIFEVSESSIRLKINDDVFVSIPKVVFASKADALKYGQSVLYSIKRRSNGFRFQDIDINPDQNDNPHKNTVMELLNSIPRRT